METEGIEKKKVTNFTHQLEIKAWRSWRSILETKGIQEEEEEEKPNKKHPQNICPTPTILTGRIRNSKKKTSKST